MQVNVLVFFVSSSDVKVLSNRDVIGFLSVVRKPSGSSNTLRFRADALI